MIVHLQKGDEDYGELPNDLAAGLERTVFLLDEYNENIAHCHIWHLLPLYKLSRSDGHYYFNIFGYHEQGTFVHYKSWRNFFAKTSDKLFLFWAKVNII